MLLLSKEEVERKLSKRGASLGAVKAANFVSLVGKLGTCSVALKLSELPSVVEFKNRSKLGRSKSTPADPFPNEEIELTPCCFKTPNEWASRKSFSLRYKVLRC